MTDQNSAPHNLVPRAFSWARGWAPQYLTPPSDYRPIQPELTFMKQQTTNSSGQWLEERES